MDETSRRLLISGTSSSERGIGAERDFVISRIEFYSSIFGAET
jgi:hypothetical protein